MHWSLTPGGNARLIALWLVLGGLASLLLAAPARLEFALGGGALGAIGGWLQLMAMRETSAALLSARDAMAVRRTLASTRWGKGYLVLFWTSQAAIIGSAIATQALHAAAAALTGYCAFALVREAITLVGARELAKVPQPPSDTGSRA
jgi:hypothetical protein